MSRLIEVESLIDRSISVLCGGGNEEMAVLVEDIDSAPTIDAVEVVRCKECKWNDGKGHCKLRYGSLGVFEDVSCDDYCSYGERKESE